MRPGYRIRGVSPPAGAPRSLWRLNPGKCNMGPVAREAEHQRRKRVSLIALVATVVGCAAQNPRSLSRADVAAGCSDRTPAPCEAACLEGGAAACVQSLVRRSTAWRTRPSGCRKICRARVGRWNWAASSGASTRAPHSSTSTTTRWRQARAARAGRTSASAAIGARARFLRSASTTTSTSAATKSRRCACFEKGVTAANGWPAGSSAFVSSRATACPRIWRRVSGYSIAPAGWRSVRLRARGATPGARPGDAARSRTGEGALPHGLRARDRSDSVRWAAASGRGPTVDDGVLCRRNRIEPCQRPGSDFGDGASRQLAVRAAELDRSRGRAGRRGGGGGAPRGTAPGASLMVAIRDCPKDPAGPSGAGDKRVLDGLERDALAWLAGHRLAKDGERARRILLERCGTHRRPPGAPGQPLLDRDAVFAETSGDSSCGCLSARQQLGTPCPDALGALVFHAPKRDPDELPAGAASS